MAEGDMGHEARQVSGIRGKNAFLKSESGLERRAWLNGMGLRARGSAVQVSEKEGSS
jgi:hypothetical protein